MKLGSSVEKTLPSGSTQWAAALFGRRCGGLPWGSVYRSHIARTNIEIDEQLAERVMRRYGLRTKRAAVDLALRRLDLEPMSRDEALAMRGRGWDGDLEAMRLGAPRS